jgi:protein tyrosine/serine phosphatase
MRILDSGKKTIAQVLRYMINELSAKEHSSIIVHCTAGKDRTGVFIMVLLGLCGVDDEIIAREYDLSRIGYFGKENIVFIYIYILNIVFRF